MKKLLCCLIFSSFLFGLIYGFYKSKVQNALTENDIIEQINQQEVYESEESFMELNGDIIGQIEFDIFRKLDESVKIVIYNNMEPRQKLKFWNDKFQWNRSMRKLSPQVESIVTQYQNGISAEFFKSNNDPLYLELVKQIEVMDASDQEMFTIFDNPVLSAKANSVSAVVQGNCVKRECYCHWLTGLRCKNDCNPVRACGWFGVQYCYWYCGL